MQNEVMFAGFGGQGVMLIGQMLAYAGMEEGKNVVWFPAYGPEMRGGTAYCTVQVSTETIGSPVVARPGCIAVLNRPSLDKFHTRVRTGGLLIINTSLIDATTDRTDISVLNVPANQIALDAGTSKGANMCMLGAYAGRTKCVTLPTLQELVRVQFKSKPQFIDANLVVLEKGYEIGAQAD